MVITAGVGQKEIFDYVTFIAGLETMTLDTVEVPTSEFVAEIESQAAAICGDSAPGQERSFQVMRSAEELYGSVSVDRERVSQVVHELLVNAFKYSPSQGRIVLGADYNRESTDYLDITISNTARPADALDSDGQPVFGIPYDFSELVFDLFYTIDAFRTELPGERWGYGTGLYVVRKLVKRHGGWVSAGNGVDYTTGTPETMVRVTVTLPITKEG
jgi:signal transduction histidine kinase